MLDIDAPQQDILEQNINGVLIKADLLMTHDGFIPEDKLYIKLGGDHGQGSLKLKSNYFLIVLIWNDLQK